MVEVRGATRTGPRGAGRRAALPAAAGLVFVLALSGPPAGAAAAGQGTSADPTPTGLSEAQFEAAEAERRLDELTALLTEGADELSRLGEQVRRLDLDAEAAMAAQESARRRGAEIEIRVGEAEQRLTEVERVLAERRDARAARAVQLYKRGLGGGSPDILGSLAAAETGRFTDGLAYLEALFVADAARQADVEAVFAVAQAARVRLVGLREDARTQEQVAGEAAALAEGVRTDQAQVAAAVGAQQARRSELLGTLEADLAARDALVRRLESSSGTLGLRVGADVGDAWIARLPEVGRPWGEPITSAASSAPIDPRLLAAVAWTESNFRPSVVSSAGAVGLCQLLPSTAAMLDVDPYDPEGNLLGGARYLRQMLDRYPGRPELAIAAYNAGPGRVDDAGAIPAIPETQAYVARVLGRYGELSAE